MHHTSVVTLEALYQYTEAFKGFLDYIEQDLVERKYPNPNDVTSISIQKIDDLWSLIVSTRQNPEHGVIRAPHHSAEFNSWMEFAHTSCDKRVAKAMVEMFYHTAQTVYAPNPDTLWRFVDMQNSSCHLGQIYAPKY